MPVTKTAKRALRSSLKKREVNNKLLTRLEIAVRIAKKEKTEEKVREASSVADIVAKKGKIHKNKASRIKSQLSKLVSSKTSAKK